MVLCLGFAAMFATPAVQAQDAPRNNFARVGKPFYDSSGHSALSVAMGNTTKDRADKAAGIVMEFEQSGEDYKYNGTYGRQVVVFVGTADWRKFLVVWKKARALPLADNYFKDSSYFDGSTMLNIGKDSDGDMSFTMGSNPNAEGVPQDVNIFELSAKDVPAFDAVLKSVSLYFSK